MKLEPEPRADFMAEADGEDRPVSQIMREVMSGYIKQRRQAREYHATCGARSSRPRIDACWPGTVE